MSAPAIRVENLSKRYIISHQNEDNHSLRQNLTNALARLVGRNNTPSTANRRREEFWALRDLDFEIAPGETVAIIGANGAGKSTLLKILSRVTAPTTGRAVINGRVASLLEVGTGFHPELSGRENIFLNGAILGMSRDEIHRKFDAIVAFAEVEEFIDTPVKRYSSGMYTRLAFSVAAHLDCEILIVDEVLSVGDATFQAKSVTKMTQIMEAGKTILFVSHNMAAAQKLCRTAIHLEKGHIKAMGPSPEIIANYLQNTSTQSEFNPTLRKNYVPDLTILDARLQHNGKPTNEFAPGEPITVQLHVDVLRQRSFNVELLIRDEQGQPILFAPSGLIQDIKFGQTTGPVTIEAQLPSLLLAAGTYSIDTILCHSGVCFYERIESALRFTVTPHALGPQNFHFRQRDGFGHQILHAQFRQIS